MTTLQFSPFSSTILPEFWTSLTKLKIDELKLSQHPVPVKGVYHPGRRVLDRDTGAQLSLGTSITFDGDGLNDSPVASTSTSNPANTSCTTTGTLLNFNTIEDFKRSDKQALFAEASEALWQTITQSDNLTAAQLNTVFAIAFAELKKYVFYYWFAFPAFIAKPAWTVDTPLVPVESAFNSDQVDAINATYQKHLETTLPAEAGACLLRTSRDEGGYASSTLSQASVFFANTAESDRILLFVDPSSDSNALGWPLRNILAYLNVRHSIRKLRIIALRSTISESLTGTISNEATEGEAAYDLIKPLSSGWEKNSNGRLAPRMADLGALMDPTRLAEQAVDLNLKLMKWRILPNLNLEKIKETKCLLLGAGTLGCYVSRSLMAWGVRKITLVDSGKVSYSNPVRQPLFEYQDCFEGGKPKAACAAEALKRIYPSVDATGIEMAIPMPGHPVSESSLAATKATVERLEKLMDEHDVVYLLMDSRESRWLPTLLGAAKGKLVMNAALGFDTYLVMRHGVLAQPIEQRLGCYYCNDIVAPMDSLSDRTLDQMCTVTRPGLAAIASASAVELMTAVLQHPKGLNAPSELTKATESTLGSVPHQLRGSLGDFSQLKITGQAYKNCTACSDKVVDVYRKEGIDMLLKAFEDAKYLEQITGLDALHAETEAVLEAVDWDEDDDEM